MGGGRGIKLALILVGALALPGCAHDNKGDSANAPAAAPLSAAKLETTRAPLIASAGEAGAMVGKVVGVRGIALRAKLGDSVKTEQQLMVVCLGPRFPDDKIGQTVTAEGRLEKSDEFQATRGPQGEISQGTEPGTSTFVIRSCTLR